ncbi:nicotinamide riboside transporter PnuC [Anaerosporobacter faecicola]|uniref:nicotinamide riboside transporter PnuC n=1 Tax=Anaerosporobacter faecicola TaxID=2718714 RepID=UPI00143AA6A7|nr:nicotinamide riboside transporter PnuC [Anaerosporobacter faecicola]
MNKLTPLVKSFQNLTKFERRLLIFSLTVVFLSFLCSSQRDTVTVVASLIGVTALIFVSKGDVLGQILTVIFSLLYALISLTFHYYGEMITYLFMTTPIAILSIISWLRNPFEKGKSEVTVNQLDWKEILFLLFLSGTVTTIFYFILVHYHTNNIVFSTISITTSFLASYLMFRRSAFYALAYAANDLVLIVLWILASIEDRSYIPMIICFLMFLLNDLYGFFNWSKIRQRQQALKNSFFEVEES